MSANQLSERLALTGPKDEITQLADTFDAMMDRLEHAFDAQRRFIANASHELRTPLAAAAVAEAHGAAPSFAAQPSGGLTVALHLPVPAESGWAVSSQTALPTHRMR